MNNAHGMLGNSLVNVRDVVFLHTVYVVNVRLLSLELCEDLDCREQKDSII